MYVRVYLRDSLHLQRAHSCQQDKRGRLVAQQQTLSRHANELLWVRSNRCSLLFLQPTNNAMSWFVESVSPVYPRDLWKAQREARGRPIQPPPPKRFYGASYGCLADGTKCCLTTTINCTSCAGKTYFNPSQLWGCKVGLPSLRLFSRP